MSLGPLKAINDKQLNTRSKLVHTPIKGNTADLVGKENHFKQTKRLDPNNDHHHQPAQKKKREKLSALCKTPPSLIKTRGKDYHRGLFR